MRASRIARLALALAIGVPAALLATPAPAGEGAAPAEAALDVGQTATGAVDFEGERDLVRLELVQGSQLIVDVKGQNGLAPAVDVLDADGAEVTVPADLRKNNAKKAKIKKWPVPSTGVFYLSIGAADGSASPTGPYKLKTKVKPAPAPPKTEHTLAADDEIDVVLDARPGSRLDVTLKAVKGETALPQVIEILDPEGAAIPFDPPVKNKLLKTGQKLKKVPLDLFGTYRLRFGLTDGEGRVVIKLKLVPPSKNPEKPDFTGSTGGEALAGALEAVRLAPAVSMVDVGGTAGIRALGRYADGRWRDVTDRSSWSVSNRNALDVSNATESCGEVTGVAAGGATVIASFEHAQSESALVLVGGATVSGVSIVPDAFSVPRGETRRVSALATFDGADPSAASADVSDVAEFTSDDGRFTVDGRLVTATGAEGDGGLSVSLDGTAGTGATATVAAPRVLALHVTPAYAEIASGSRSYTVTADLSDGTTQDVTSSAVLGSDHEGVATTAGSSALFVAPGTAGIRATFEGVTSAPAILNCGPVALRRLMVDDGGLSGDLPEGLDVELEALAVFADGGTRNLARAAVWSSDDDDAVSISTDGVARAASGASAVRLTATVTTGGGPTVATLDVFAAPAVDVGLVCVPSFTTVAVGGTSSYRVLAVRSDGTFADRTQQMSWNPSGTVLGGSAHGTFSGAGEGAEVVTFALAGRTVEALVFVGGATATSLAAPPEVTPASGRTSRPAVELSVGPAVQVVSPLGVASWFPADGKRLVPTDRFDPIVAPPTAPPGLRAVREGATTARAVVRARVSDELSVAVAPPADDALRIFPQAPVLLPGQMLPLAAQITRSDGVVQDRAGASNWSDQGAAASVNGVGVVTANAPGTATVSVTEPVSGLQDDVTVQSGGDPPVLNAVAPSTAERGTTGLDLTLTGTDLDGGNPVVTFEGAGISVVGGPVTVSATTVTVTIDVAGGATAGDRDVTLTTDDGSTTLTDGFTITAPAPTIVGVTPLFALIPGAGSQATGITVTGTGFASGDAVTLESHAGVAVSNVVVVNGTTITADVTVQSSASRARLDVSVVQSAGNGGNTVTLTDVLKIGPEDPRITSFEPAFVYPGTQSAAGRLVGTNFQSGVNIAFEPATGVTISNVTRVSSTLITYTIDVSPDASPTLLDVTLTNPSDLARVFGDALAISPRPPVVGSIDASTLGRGLASFDVTIRGTNFRSGATVSASGDGVTFGGISMVSSERIDAEVTVTSGAALGARDLTVRHAASEGGRGGTLEGAFVVADATPSVTAVAPATLGVTGASGPTRRFRLVVSGTNFVDGAAVSVARGGGSGISVPAGGVTVVSGTELHVLVDLAGNATTGAWDVTVTNPAALGDSGSTGNGRLTIVGANTLAVNRVRDDTGPTFGGNRVTVQGSGFTAGCVVEFDGERAESVVRIDANTLVCTVPRPATPATAGTPTVSASGATSVDVKVVNNPAGMSTSATLADGYAYAADSTRFEVVEIFPAQGATGVAPNVKSAVLRLSSPANPHTAISGSTTGTHCFWFQSGSSFVSGRTVGFGGDPRFLVLSRTSGGSLPADSTTNPGRYVLDVATAVKAFSGVALTPARLSSGGNHDQWFFTIGGGTDATAPTISSSNPAASATGVSLNTSVSVTFNEELDPLTVTSTTVSLSDGNGTVPTALRLSDDLKTVTLTPQKPLAASTQHTLTLTSTLADLFGNGISQTTRTFTTGTGVDGTAPTIASVVFDEIPSSLDGSGTYVSGNDTDGSGNPIAPGSTAAFDLYLSRWGWTVHVTFEDQGGSGIDASSFSAKASVASGSRGANQELAGSFDVTPTGASWTIDETDQLTSGDNVTLTFLVSDAAGNTSSAHVVTIDVIDRDTAVAAGAGGDHDPFDARQTWVLRSDTDRYTATFGVDPNDGSIQTVTTTGSSNGVLDIDEALRVNGMNTTSMTASAVIAVNGPSVGTNAIFRRLFLERLRELVRARFGIDEDGSRDADDPDVEFLLNGEQGSLASLPTWSSTSTSNSTRGFSEMELGGDTGPNSSGTGVFTTVGIAFTDIRNRRNEANLNAGAPAGQNDGIFVLNIFKFNQNTSPTLTEWGNRVTSVLQTAKGGTPVGEHAQDHVILAGSFDRTSGGNTQAQNDRYDVVMDALEAAAMNVSSVVAHEIGHSTGLVPDGAPKTGLFGHAHRSNAFTEATSGSPNTPNHLDALGNDIMGASSSSDDRLATGSIFQRFSAYLDGYLRGRQVHDEGK